LDGAGICSAGATRGHLIEHGSGRANGPDERKRRAGGNDRSKEAPGPAAQPIHPTVSVDRREQLKWAGWAQIWQIAEGNPQHTQLAHQLGASVAGGNVRRQACVGGRIDVRGGEGRQALVVRVILVQHAMGPDVLIR
jgi:hypothetical protein